ncbi:hypothetical protein [Caldifermentibacillus hisashii]|uniref:hypothetical protein n=1 Tax=Caldifermentibacillus hisashii TaxID=996558 RepID=UPI0030E75F83
MDYKEIAKEILENNYLAGVRALADDEEYKVGDYCRDSYEWDLENDCSTYHTTGEIANGTCATMIETEYFKTDDWETELAENIKKAVEANKERYGDKQVIVVSKQVNNDGMFDPGEIRLVNAKVIAVLD